MGMTVGELAVDSYGGGIGLSTNTVSVLASESLGVAAVGGAQLTGESVGLSVGADTTARSVESLTLLSRTMAATAVAGLNLSTGAGMEVLAHELSVDSLGSVRARTTSASTYAEGNVSVAAKGAVGVAAADLSIAAGSSVSISGAGTVGVATSLDASTSAQSSATVFAGEGAIVTASALAVDALASLDTVSSEMTLLAGNTAEVSTHVVGLEMSSVTGSVWAKLQSAGDIGVSAALGTTLAASSISLNGNESVSVSSGDSVSLLADTLSAKIASAVSLLSEDASLEVGNGLDIFAGSTAHMRASSMDVDVYDGMVLSAANALSTTAAETQVRTKGTASISATPTPTSPAISNAPHSPG